MSQGKSRWEEGATDTDISGKGRCRPLPSDVRSQLDIKTLRLRMMSEAERGYVHEVGRVYI